MNRNIRQTLLAPAALLLTAGLGLSGCTRDDSELGRLPQGAVPLRVGDVSVAGVQTAGKTRAAIAENATGYTGIRKSSFVENDVLTLELSNDGGNSTETTVTATLNADGQWVIAPAGVFLQLGTTLTATHTATEQTPGIRADHLKAESGDCRVGTNGKVTITMKHVNAMIDITLPADTDATAINLTDITLAANNGTSDEVLSTMIEEEAGNVKHYRTIAAPGTVKSITATINGQNYVAILPTALTVEANKRYPVSLTFKAGKLAATVGNADLNWGVGDIVDIPATGYTRIIDSPEALAQFAQDVNEDKTEATHAVVLQTADIDISQLKPAGEAGNNPLTNSAYTYTATKDNWVPIGIGDGASETVKCFQGSYNGNGHTISNVKLAQSAGLLAGFFGVIRDATLTGIHLRNIQADIKMTGSLHIAALAVQLGGSSTVSLCSATGSLKGKTTEGGNLYVDMGGLFCYINGSSSVTRCSADVDLSAEAGGGTIGGFASEAAWAYPSIVIAGCFSTGDINYTTPAQTKAGGFLSYLGDGGPISVVNCFSSGTLTDAAGYGFMSSLSDEATSITISGCYSTSTSKGGGTPKFVGFYDVYDAGMHYLSACATTADADGVTGVTGGLSASQLYSTVTAGNASITDVTTLHWSRTDGYTLRKVTENWYAADAWKANGTAAPTLDMGYEGFVWDGLYEGQAPKLLDIEGQTAYYLAPVDASGNVAWTEGLKDLCPKGWRMPTKDDFLAMTGLPADESPHSENNAAIRAVFSPGNGYWSSTEEADDAGVWRLYLNTNNTAGVACRTKANSYRVRCVRKK